MNDDLNPSLWAAVREDLRHAHVAGRQRKDDLNPARGIVWCYVGCLAVYGLGAAAWLRWDAIVGAWEWFMRGLGAAL